MADTPITSGVSSQLEPALHHVCRTLAAGWAAAKASGDPMRCVAAIEAVRASLATFCAEFALEPVAGASSLANEIRVMNDAVAWFVAQQRVLIAGDTLVKQGELFFEDVSYLPLHVVKGQLL